jgi:hypothetical protein
MKTQPNETYDDINKAAVQRVKTFFEKNDLVWTTIAKHLNEKNYHIVLDDFPLIRDIIFRSYSPYFLYGIDPQQYLSRMLSRRDDQTMNYFIVWFQFFLCESYPDWMNYQSLVNQ